MITAVGGNCKKRATVREMKIEHVDTQLCKLLTVIGSSAMGLG